MHIFFILKQAKHAISNLHVTFGNMIQRKHWLDLV